MDFYVTQESLHLRVSSVFPQEFVSAQVCRLLISVPVSSSAFRAGNGTSASSEKGSNACFYSDKWVRSVSLME